MLRSKNTSWTNRHETNNGRFGEGGICLFHFFSNRQSAKENSTNIFFRTRKFSPTNLFIRKIWPVFGWGICYWRSLGRFCRRVPVAWAAELYLKGELRLVEDDEISSLKLTAKAPTNGWLQDDPFGASLACFQGLCLAVSFKEGRFPSDSFVIWGAISWPQRISGCTDGNFFCRWL